MTIIAARRYHKGCPDSLEVAIDGAVRAPLPSHSFDWVGLAEPDAEEMESVRRQFGLHPLAVEDALTPTQLPKVEVYGDQLFIVARTATIDVEDRITYGQTALFLGPDFLVSVRSKASPSG
jgi:magnesium transporter